MMVFPRHLITGFSPRLITLTDSLLLWHLCQPVRLFNLAGDGNDNERIMPVAAVTLNAVAQLSFHAAIVFVMLMVNLRSDLAKSTSQGAKVA